MYGFGCGSSLAVDAVHARCIPGLGPPTTGSGASTPFRDCPVVLRWDCQAGTAEGAAALTASLVLLDAGVLCGREDEISADVDLQVCHRRRGGQWCLLKGKGGGGGVQLARDWFGCRMRGLRWC
jgi:hypothetical protein